MRAAPYLLVCNPDVILRSGRVAGLVAALEDDPALGVVGPRLSNPDGSLYPSARAFPDLVDAIGHGLFGHGRARNRFTRRYRLLDWDHQNAARVDWVSGACFLVRRRCVGRGRRIRSVLLHVHGRRRSVLAPGPGRVGGRL